MRRLLSAILCLSLLWIAGIPSARAVSAETSFQTADRAYALKALGIFQGDADGFALDSRPTRMEGFVMLVRLLGQEAAAQTNSYVYPFTDVPAWGDSYVGYGYHNGLTNGVGVRQFGASENLTAAQYCTWLLRALGYRDKQGDFTEKTAVSTAISCGLADRTQAARWSEGAFTRGDMVDLSYEALKACPKGKTETLVQQLADGEVLSEEEARAAGVWPGTVLTLHEGQPAAAFVADGLYELRCAGTEDALTAVSSADDERGALRIRTSMGADTQKFTIVNLGKGVVCLLAEGADRRAVNAEPVEADVQPCLSSENASESQQLVCYQEQNGAYSIRMSADLSLALTRADGSLALRTYQGGQEQEWLLLPTQMMDSSTVPDTALVSARLEQMLQQHPDGSQLPDNYVYQGAIQCMGFVREVWHTLFGTEYTGWSYAGTPDSDNLYQAARLNRGQYSEENLRELIAEAWPGDIIQLDEPEPHSMVFVWRSDTGFGVYDANWGYDNKVHRHSFLYGGLAGQDSDHISLLRYMQYPTK